MSELEALVLAVKGLNAFSVLFLIGWMICNGEEIPEPSPWAGQNTSNLNGDGLFLRGITLERPVLYRIVRN
jgi:hypothetical protein